MTVVILRVEVVGLRRFGCAQAERGLGDFVLQSGNTVLVVAEAIISRFVGVVYGLGNRGGQIVYFVVEPDNVLLKLGNIPTYIRGLLPNNGHDELL